MLFSHKSLNRGNAILRDLMPLLILISYTNVMFFTAKRSSYLCSIIGGKSIGGITKDEIEN